MTLVSDASPPRLANPALKILALDEFKMDATKSQAVLGGAFDAMESMKVLESSTTGTAEFTTWEQLSEVVYGIDEPKLGIVKGQKAFIRGVSILWWRWEGPGTWDGNVEGDSLRGWKIVREHDYMVPLKAGTTGGEVRLFG